ncbi:MAG: ribosome hibernation-promoting factor, HPF/YfiA family [Myxococcaceae bacterium]
MHLAITFRNFEASESLKDHTRERLERLVKNLDRACTAHVVLSLERHLHHADLTLSTGPLVVRAKHATVDMMASIDAAVDCLEEQLRRDKDRNKHHHRRAWVHHQQEALTSEEQLLDGAA